MSSKNLFFVLILIFITVGIFFQLLIYGPKIDDRNLLKKNIKQTVNKFKTAKLAERDLEKIEVKSYEEKENLRSIKNKFIYKNQLSEISLRMKEITSDYNLKLIDFTPAFQNYFSDTSKTPIKKLPFSITVSGKYLDIGKYLEGWSELEFFIISENISMEKKNPKSNIIEADISGTLYSWAKGRE